MLRILSFLAPGDGFFHAMGYGLWAMGPVFFGQEFF